MDVRIQSPGQKEVGERERERERNAGARREDG